jgi:hypothetical protein
MEKRISRHQLTDEERSILEFADDWLLPQPSIRGACSDLLRRNLLRVGVSLSEGKIQPVYRRTAAGTKALRRYQHKGSA